MNDEVLFEGEHLQFRRRRGWEYVEHRIAKESVMIVALTDEGRLVLVDEMRPDFTEMTPLATIATHSGPGGGTVYIVYIARGFRGDGRLAR